ncbi:ribosomal protein L22 [Didymella exigua CBS 183.55]|uniref:Ribosomal protein L22 n=1 Tax=Didymella exigua CBS 183.55 TaxID=1150837 RepID=A0A6A5R4X2_9PLEO|nr:ribosomal protein L22 [Didymella exigua CBS 183.55]KAF1922752.1 ribosomal protein L22 [Didymella exigua CBS 183.55]
MSARIPARRLGQSALAFRPRCTPWTAVPTVAQRNASTGAPADRDLSNPLLEKYLQQKEAERAATEAAQPVPDGAAPKKPSTSVRDGATYSVPSPLFSPERLIPGFRDNAPETEKAALQARAEQRRLAVQSEEEKRLLSVNIDPDPAARRSLERKLVIKSVTRHGRMTKAAKIARTERTSLYKSHFLPTSVKKIQKILRQIAGKTVSEALVQLRFSPKKVARDILKGLIVAQDEAIAGRGMGLGDKHALKKWVEQRNEVASTLADLDETTARTKGATQVIELKDGRKKLVRDPTEVYIDQAWCGRGEAWKSPEFRARGRVNMLTHRTTSFTFLLKEEKTRMRISDEIRKKRANRKLWVALPDRPVTAQRQYCLW